MGGGANPFLDESISTIVDPLGEETRELSGDDPSSMCLHCGEGNSGFRIGSKLDFTHVSPVPFPAVSGVQAGSLTFLYIPHLADI